MSVGLVVLFFPPNPWTSQIIFLHCRCEYQMKWCIGQSLAVPTVLCKNKVLSLSTDDLGSHFFQKRLVGFSPFSFYVSVYLLVWACLLFFLSICDCKPFIREDFESYLNYLRYFSWFHLSQRLPDFPIQWLTRFLLSKITFCVQKVTHISKEKSSSHMWPEVTSENGTLFT